MSRPTMWFCRHDLNQDVLGEDVAGGSTGDGAGAASGVGGDGPNNSPGGSRAAIRARWLAA